MKYIVWREPYKSYDIPQGGYFVSYKDKLCDNFSDNWFDASRYTSLGGAISRLGIYGLECVSIDGFIKANMDPKNIDVEREYSLSKLLDQEFDIDIILRKKGRIEKIDDNGNLVGDAMSQVKDFILKKLESNKKKLDNKFEKIKKITGSDLDSYTSEADEDFWNEWVNS